MELTIRHLLLILISGTLLCLIPKMASWKFDNGEINGSVNYTTALISQFYSNAIITQLVLLGPIFMDQLIDCILPTFTTTSGPTTRPFGKFSIICIIFSIDIYHFLHFTSTNDIVGIRCTYYVRFLMMYFIGFLRLLAFTEECNFISYIKYIHISFIIINIATIFQCMTAFLGSNSMTMAYISITTFGLSLIIVLFVCYHCWLRFKSKSWKEMSKVERDGYVLIIVFPTVLLVNFILYIIYPGTFTTEAVGYNLLVLQILPFSRAVFERRFILMDQSLEKKLETKRKFVRMVSHEIRTPMNIVFAGLDIIKAEIIRAKCRPKALEAWTDIKNAGGEAVAILDELLLYEKLESGAMDLDIIKFEVWPYIYQAISTFRIMAEHKGVILRFDCDEFMVESRLRMYFLMADLGKMNQVTRNILSNAIKFSAPGNEIIITAEVVTDTSENTILRVSVKDFGIGISPENLPKLFNQVLQIEPNKNQNGGGSGIGLWITKSIMDLHQGKVFAHSEGEGRGCTFTFELQVQRESGLRTEVRNSVSSCRVSQIAPLSETRPLHTIPLRGENGYLVRAFSSNDSDNTEQERKSKVISALHFSDKIDEKIDEKIEEVEEVVEEVFEEVEKEVEEEKVDDVTRLLIVDDAPLNVKMLKRLLEMRYSNISTAGDGQEALTMVKISMEEGRPFHIVLSDFQMPVMDGPTSVRAMRAAGYDGTIIGVTGNGLVEDQQLFLRSGVNKILLKPVESDVLFQSLSDFLTVS